MSAISLSKGETPNEMTLHLPGLVVWFSHETPVAFRSAETGRLVRENDWGVTTGKHLNRIDGGDKHAKARRIPGATFERELDIAINTAMHRQAVGA